VSGAIYGASTLGSIAGVFVSGYVLIDHLGLTAIFRLTGGMTLLLAVGCLCADRWFIVRRSGPAEDAPSGAC
jgi:hypothetical protein